MMMQGTRFRIWATQTLREHLLRGYTLNDKRLRERGFNEVGQAIELLATTLKNQPLVTDQGLAVLDIVQRYTRVWRLLLQYNEDRTAPSDTAITERELVSEVQEQHVGLHPDQESTTYAFPAGRCRFSLGSPTHMFSRRLPNTTRSKAAAATETCACALTPNTARRIRFPRS
jgi:hypothetical protein